MTHQYLYALLRPHLSGMAADLVSSTLAGLTGVTGPVEMTRFGPDILIWGPHDGSEILRTRRHMLAHTRVLEALMPLTTVMPMRFGIVASGLDRVGALLHDRQADLGEQFARLLDHVELGLRISFPRDAALAHLIRHDPGLVALHGQLAGRGHEAYYARIDLGRKIAEALDTARGRAQKRVLAALVPLVATHVLRAPESDVEVLRAEFLVPRAGQEAFATAAAAAAEACGFCPGADPVIQLIGPVPPYHFVSFSLERALTPEVV